MTRLFAAAVLVLFFSSDLMALKKAEGYYISAKTGKKYTTTFLLPVSFLASGPDYERMQKEITHLFEGEKKILTPDKVSEFSFTYKGKTTVMRSVLNTLWYDHDLVFLETVVGGSVSLYNYYETRSTNGTFYKSTNPTTGTVTTTSQAPQQYQYLRLVLQREGSELVRIRRLFFKKDTSEFFADCPSLVSKIQSGELSTLEEIVKVYNETCLEI